MFIVGFGRPMTFFMDGNAGWEKNVEKPPGRWLPALYLS